VPDGHAEGQERSLYIAQGEHAVGRATDEVISTILGSCVAVCLWDEAAKIGGMNHILLPAHSDAAGRSGLDESAQFGAFAMETLINALIREGAAKSFLRAKVFGGAAVVPGLSDIGARNSEFALAFLHAEGIPCDGKSLGGTQARHIKFWPQTGQARMRFVPEVVVDETAAPARVALASDLELF